MSDRDNQTTALEQVASGPLDVMHGAHPPVPSPLKNAHRRLRGRYGLAGLLAAVGLAAGAWLGWNSQEPQYRCESMIYIASAIPSRHDPLAERVLPRFDAFVEAQVGLLHSRALTKSAMEKDSWVALRRRGLVMTEDEFEEKRTILHVRRTQHFKVQFTDPDPDVALAGVQSIIAAYKDAAPYLMNTDRTFDEAVTKVERVAGELKAKREQIDASVVEYGSVQALNIWHEASIKRRIAIDEALAEVTRAIASQKAFAAAEKARAADKKPSPALTAEELGQRDPKMRALLRQLKILKAREAEIRKNHGPQWEPLKQVGRETQALELEIEEGTAAYNRSRGAGAPEASMDALRILEARQAKLKDELKAHTKSARRIKEAHADVTRFQSEKDDLVTQLAQTTRLRDHMAAQFLGEGPLRFPDKGHRPTKPFRDRRLMMAAGWGLLGAILGVLLVLMVSLRDRRLRNAGDIHNELSQLRLLGFLPSLPADLTDDGNSNIVAHCVHQIRTLLQINHPGDQGYCTCITGPGVGSGKTTLTAALGLSFGTSGSRTLLIDADLTGRGLTRRVCEMLVNHVRRVAGHVDDGASEADRARASEKRSSSQLVDNLRAESSTVQWPQPKELPALLMRSIDRLGLQTAKSTGVVDHVFALADLLYGGVGRDELASRLVSAIASQGSLTFGTPTEWIPAQVSELGRGGPNGTPLDHHLYPTGIDTLAFLPLRGLGQSGMVSASTVAKILARVRDEFDVVLIDTGPVPGSVETSMVAAHADSVILVVSPGDHRPDAEKAVMHLEEVGARIAGLVLNRADHKEVLAASRSRSSPGPGVAVE